MKLTSSERLHRYLVSYGANQAKKVASPKASPAVKKAAAPKPRKSAGAASISRRIREKKREEEKKRQPKFFR